MNLFHPGYLYTYKIELCSDDLESSLICLHLAFMTGGSGVVFILGLIAASIVSFPSLACGN